MMARLGPDNGENFVALVRDSASYLFDLVRRHAIACDPEQTGWIQPAHSPGRVLLSERRVRQWSRRGAPAELVDQARMQALLGSEVYYGGMLNPTGGHINPLGKFCGASGPSLLADEIRAMIWLPISVAPYRCIDENDD